MIRMPTWRELLRGMLQWWRRMIRPFMDAPDTAHKAPLALAEFLPWDWIGRRRREIAEAQAAEEAAKLQHERDMIGLDPGYP